MDNSGSNIISNNFHFFGGGGLIEETESKRTVSHGILLSSTYLGTSYSHRVLHAANLWCIGLAMLNYALQYIVLIYIEC